MDNKKLPQQIEYNIIGLILNDQLDNSINKYNNNNNKSVEVEFKRWKLSLATVSWDYFQLVSKWCTKAVNTKTIECDSEFYYHINNPYCVLKVLKEIKINSSLAGLKDFFAPKEVDCYSLFGDDDEEEEDDDEDDFKTEKNKINNFYDKEKFSEMLYGNVEKLYIKHLSIPGFKGTKNLPPFNFTNLKSLIIKTKDLTLSYIENQYTLKSPLSTLKVVSVSSLQLPMALLTKNLFNGLTVLALGIFRDQEFNTFLKDILQFMDTKPSTEEDHTLVPTLEHVSFKGSFGYNELDNPVTLQLLERFTGLLTINLNILDISQMLYRGDKKDYALSIQSISQNHFKKNNHSFNNNNRDLTIKVDQSIINYYSYLLPITTPKQRLEVPPPIGYQLQKSAEELNEEGSNRPNFYTHRYYY